MADARQIIAAAEKRAQEIKQPQNIAVVDSGGNLVANIRMDGAWTGSVDISITKARGHSTSKKALDKNSQPGGQFYGSTPATVAE